jgi:hypothetical protein
MLKSLDENFIQSMFKLPNVSTLGDIENDEISEMISDESED